MSDKPIQGLPGTEEGFVVFKILRNARGCSGPGQDEHRRAQSGRLWFDDYEDRVIFDDAGLFDYSRFMPARLSEFAAAFG